MLCELILVLHEILSHGYLYLFALLMPVVWIRELCVLFTYDDCLCISGRHHALPECDMAVLLQSVQ